MFLKDFLKEFKDKKVKLYVDMDGVIAHYDVGVAAEFDTKRPLLSSIKKLKEISEMENIELYILSITRMDEGFNQKNEWLDKYAPFFKTENRVIISRESNDFKSSWDLKTEYLQSLKREKNSVIIVIDDDPLVLKKIGETNEDVIRLKDTALVD